MLDQIFRSLFFAQTKRVATLSSRARSLPTSCYERLESRAVLSTFLVHNLADSGDGSLRAAIEQANDNLGSDVIRFRAGLTGTIALTSGQLEIRDSLRLLGPGESRLTISGNLQSRVFNVESPAGPVTLRGFTVADGLASDPEEIGIRVVRGGGILNRHGELQLVELTFRNNRAVDLGSGGAADVVGGGAIANTEQAVLTVNRCTFVGNSASGGTRYAFGGAVASVTSSQAFINQSRFTSNLVTNGAVNYGGAVAAFGGSSASVSKSEFTGNKAMGSDQQQAFGGALAARPGTVENSPSELVVVECRFSSNVAEASAKSAAGGGAVYSHRSLFVVQGSELASNCVSSGAASGGGVQSDQSIGLVIESRLTSNRVISSAKDKGLSLALGGGIASTGGGILTIAKSELSMNEARAVRAYGGGLFHGGAKGEDVAMLFIDRSSLSRNLAATTQSTAEAVALGGGIFSGNPDNAPTVNTSVMVTRSEIRKNAAVAEGIGKAFGGGIYSLGEFSIDRRLQRQLLDGRTKNTATTGFAEFYGELTLV